VNRSGLAAIGAATLVYTLGVGAIALLWGAGRISFDGPPRFEPAFLPAAFAGAVVVFPSRDARSVLEYLLYLVTAPAVAFMRIAVWWSEAVRAGDRYRYPAELADPLVAHWPILAGLGLAVPLLLFRANRLSRSAPLQGAGVFGLGTMVLILMARLAWPPILPPELTGAVSWLDAFASLLPAAAAGIFLRGRAASAGLVALVLIAGWLPFAWFQLRPALAEGGIFLVAFVAPVASALLLVLLAAMGRAKPDHGLAFTHV
jgi:hypothetical protein